VVLVDYPGLNWWIARRAKAHGIPVFYYLPPQIWAWATWRAKKMRRLTDHVLCCLPFEEPWLRQRGCNATLVGHPFFDEVRRRPLDEEFLARQRRQPGPLVAILPGSRDQEVAHNLSWLLKAAAAVRQAVPEARFAVGAFKERQAEVVRREIKGQGSGVRGQGELPIEVYVGKTAELMHLAKCCMACSGSVSLELLYHTTPTVILYWISRPAYFVQGLLRKAKYITLVNLLAQWQADSAAGKSWTAEGGTDDHVLFPEYLTCEDRSAEIAAHLVDWLTHDDKRQSLVEQLTRLKEKVAQEGASARAAEYVLAALSRDLGI
jgi:lipid-A-disaccharide synthase